MHRIPLRAGAVALALSALAEAAQAAPPSALKPPVPAPSVATVVVTARGGSLSQPDLAQQKRALDHIAGSVALVDAADFQGRYAGTLRDVLKDAPGVFIQNRYGQELRVSVRGSGIGRGFHLRGIELLQDGVPWNLADGSGDFYAVDPLSLRSAEIYKGGNGLRFGSSTLGGAVNLVTATARTALAANQLRLEGGSFGAVRASATLSAISGDWDGLATLTGNHVDGARQHSRSNDLYLNANLGRRLSRTAETRLYLSLIDTRQQLPGTVTLSQALSFPDGSNPTASDLTAGGNQQRNQTIQRLADRTSFRLGGGQIDVEVWATHKHLSHPIFQVIYQDGWTWGADARWTGRLDLAGHENELVAGVRATAGNNHAQQYVNFAGARANGMLTANAHQRASNVEGYAEDGLHLTPTLTLTAGAKYAVNDRDLLNRLAPAKSADNTYYGLSPRIGLLWDATPTFQVLADLTRSRDVPDFSDLAQASPFVSSFAPLQAQRAWTGEAGVRGRVGPVRLDFSLYRAQIEGELLQFTVEPSIPAATFNAGSTVHQGVEASARMELARNLAGADADDRLSVFGLWNHNDFRFEGDRTYGRNRIAGTPPDVLRFELRYAKPHLGPLTDVYLAPQIDWVPVGAWADQANTLRAPGYALLGVEAGFALPNRLALFVEARNLTGEAYVSDVSVITDARRVATSIFYPGDRRSVFAGLRYAF